MKQAKVSEFDKNSVEKIRVALQDYKGQEYCDVRVWVNNSGSKEPTPTRKGVTFSVELIEDLIAGLEKARDRVFGVN